MPNRSTNVHLGGVLVTQDSILDFCSLPPVGSDRGVKTVKGKFNRGTKLQLEIGKRPSLLKLVEKVDGGVTVQNKRLWRSLIGNPYLGHVPSALDFQREDTCRAKVSVVASHNVPISGNFFLERSRI